MRASTIAGCRACIGSSPGLQAIGQTWCFLSRLRSATSFLSSPFSRSNSPGAAALNVTQHPTA